MINNRGATVIVIWFACVISLFFCLGVGQSPADEITDYCKDIRATVATLGPKEAERVARAAGASEQQIAEAKKCLRLR
jgi:hypothetical protein